MGQAPPRRGAGFRIDAAFGAAALRPHIAFEAGDPRLLAQLAARGLGVAIVPQSVADARRELLDRIAIIRPAPTGRIALAWRTEGPISPAAQALITRVQAAVARSTQ